MNQINIAIIDYGTGNSGSLVSLFKGLGYRTKITRNQEDIDRSNVILLPGVGAYSQAMANLRESRLVDFLQEKIEKGKPAIGICLGMQMLFDSSEEIEHTEGLGLIPGKIVALNKPKWHIGWNSVHRKGEDSFSNLISGEAFYFNHSFTVDCCAKYVCGTAWHDRPITAAVKKDNIIGFQFHPEKSQEQGAQLVKMAIREILNVK
jgi:glutamine amidotransferase